MNDVLRLATAGSVDDGKSTLIGRLLFDSRAVLEDQLAALRAATERRGGGELELALLTDGLRAEREQGITIDVAYRYFATPRRKFIIADCPGHYQYTRNMITGASTADAALVLVDVTKGIVEQTTRHFVAAALLRVPNLVVCVNKMDLVVFSEDAFRAVVEQISALARRFSLPEPRTIPISALAGDNVVHRSQRTPWYGGPPLLELLETLEAGCPCETALRLPVQGALLPRAGEAERGWRGYMGWLASGCVSVGDEVAAMPGGATARVAELRLGETALESVQAPASVTLRLDRDLDVARGDMLCRTSALAAVSRELGATLCWLAQEPLRLAQPYLLRQATTETRALVTSVESKLDLRTLEETSDSRPLAFNELGRAQLRTALPLCHDRYADNRLTGSFILIDETTCATVAAGMIL